MKEEKDIHPVDKLFRQSLESYSTPPPPTVWKNIRSGIKGSRTAGGKFTAGNTGLFLGSVVILSLAGMLAYVAFFRSNTVQTSVNKDINTQISTNQASQNQVSAVNTIEPQTNKQTTQTGTQSGNHAAAAEFKKPQANTQNIVSRIPAKHKAENQLSRPNSANKVPDPGQIRADATARQQTLPAQQAQSTMNEKVSSETGRTTAQQLTEPILVKEIAASEEDNKTKITSDSVQAISVPGADSFEGTQPGKLNPEDNSGKTEPKEQEKKTTPSFGYSLGFNAGYGQEKIMGLNTGNMYSAQFFGGITHLKTGINLETGIGYSYFSERAIFRYNFSRTDTLGYTGYTYLNALDSSYLFIFKPTVADTLFSRDTTTLSSYAFFDIPFYLSKTIFRTGKFSLGIKTGLSVAFMITHKEKQPGYQPDGSTLVDITNKSYQRVSTSWQWLIAPQLCWDMTDKIIFRLEPSATFYLGSPYEAENRPADRPWRPGISAGLLFRFY